MFKFDFQQMLVEEQSKQLSVISLFNEDPNYWKQVLGMPVVVAQQGFVDDDPGVAIYKIESWKGTFVMKLDTALARLDNMTDIRDSLTQEEYNTIIQDPSFVPPNEDLERWGIHRLGFWHPAAKLTKQVDGIGMICLLEEEGVGYLPSMTIEDRGGIAIMSYSPGEHSFIKTTCNHSRESPGEGYILTEDAWTDLPVYGQNNAREMSSDFKDWSTIKRMAGKFEEAGFSLNL